MNQRSAEFNIKPNAAFRRRSWRWLLLLLVVVSLGSALRFAWLGYWMILPFSLLELTLLIWIMEKVKRNANYVEKIVISGDKLEIHHLEKGKNKDWGFPLYWVRMNLVKPSHPWYPHKLQLGASGKWIEIGRCLTEEERFNLADAIGAELQQFKSTDDMNHA